MYDVYVVVCLRVFVFVVLFVLCLMSFVLRVVCFCVSTVSWFLRCVLVSLYSCLFFCFFCGRFVLCVVCVSFAVVFVLRVFCLCLFVSVRML